MITICKINHLTLRSLAIRCNLVTRPFSDKNDDTDSDSDGKSKKSQKPKPPTKQETATDRLNKLLASMQTDDNLTVATNVNMAKPGRNKKREQQQDNSKNVIEAAKKVASLLGEENAQQTESELLTKLLSQTSSPSTQSTPKEDKKSPNELSLSELIVGMKIDRRQPANEYSRGDYVRNTLSSRPARKNDNDATRSRSRNQHARQPAPSSGSVNLFGANPLDIFNDHSKLRESPDILKTWAQLNQYELKLACTHPPANYFQKMALWTEQGKLWKFPIDNEQGLDEEAATDFSEHIFLEQHLEPWCPTRGPIRHFMELVCVGLSKNPYLTAKEKKAHIMWYQNYFEEKKDILKEIIIDHKDAPNERESISKG